METNSHPLALARLAAGMTRVDFADRIRAAAARRDLRSGTDKHRVRKWEVLHVTPDAETQQYIAEALGIPPRAVTPKTWPNWLPAAVVPLGPSTIPALREALRTVDRRSFLTAVPASATVALAADWAHATPGTLIDSARDGKPVGDDVVELLEEGGSRLTALVTEQRQHTVALLDAHLSTVTDLIAHGRYPHRLGQRLHRLAASLAQTAGWWRFDHGRHHDATVYWVASLHSAHAVGDPDLGANALGDLAYGAAWRRDHTAAADLLRHALTRAEHPAARALLQLRLARALAAQGEKQATLRALDAAEHLLGAAASRPRPVFCTWLSDADLAVDAGQALLDLGDTDRAHRLIEEGQDLLPQTRAKTRAVFLTYQAASDLKRGEPERAASAARESLLVARRIGAPRCEQLVHDLTPRFQHYQSAEGVPGLLHLTRAT
ncbi:XRE family transcriptional regulator [Streptomyces katsurahamanus]|uniref:XRE family transcriptional regulator n=1 Tax=Streptomyces katsurahamanus TaxID=2577098 RepID=A0ABW9NYB3_9ACTN|nr:XRE family transcriptional regulator [Streptomyces katsurahamanus]MQS38315.1 XRE family transcriptional regulator [Streptomyces katsurahamanus]